MTRAQRYVDPVLRVQSQITDRDCVLLDWLAEHGVLTSAQIAQALFPSLDYAQERLRALVGLRVLERFRPNRAGGGSFPYHYLLSQLGLEVIAAQRGEHLERGYRDRARRRRWQLTNRANLAHLVGTNGFFAALAGHARTRPGCELTRWWSARQCQQMGAFATAGADIDQRLYTPKSRPDGHGIWVEDDSQTSFFLEYDTGTERPISRLVDKTDGYVDLARITRQVWPVLFWLPGPVRERHLHEELTDAGVIYPVATATHDAGNPADAVWWLHRRPGRRLRLAELGDQDLTATAR
ncbi:MAG TPA: replication-relaxation family protein [Actinoplanes sp.]|nr:replication-relaxation family protein [Actinoplanes sp.]